MATMERSLYYKGWEAAVRDEYNAKSNPEGCIQLGLADNQLSYDLLEPQLASAKIPPLGEYACYSDYKGLWSFREAVAKVMTRTLGTSQPLDPHKVITCAGATSMVEMFAWALADPGDAFIIPAPYYPGFDVDVGARSGVEIIPAPTGSGENFDISVQALEEAFGAAESKGQKVRAVLISSPSNPLGRTFLVPVLQQVLEFCRTKSIHLISDEIYAGSVYASPGFTSVLDIMDESDASFVHVIYGLAKDFGIPGFRVGICYTSNEDLFSALGRLCRFYSPSAQTQVALVETLSDETFLDTFLKENNGRLRTRSQMVVDGLANVGVKCMPSNAGLFVWADLRHLLPTNDFEGEARLFFQLLEEAKVNISPGQTCHCPEPGWFRVCFASASVDAISVALHRLKAFVQSRNKTQESN